MADNKLMERNLPGMNRRSRFVQVEHAENAGAALKRLLTYFARERALVAVMLLVVVFGKMCIRDSRCTAGTPPASEAAWLRDGPQQLPQ